MKYQNIIGKTRDNYNPVQNIWQKVKRYNKNWARFQKYNT